MKKQNCWEFKKCGRGPAGKNDCTAAKDSLLNRVHGGLNAGRSCWVSAGTNSIAAASGTFAIQLKECLRCDFFKLVQNEEERSEIGFSATRLGMLKLLKLQQSAPPRSVPGNTGSPQIDAQLREEFVQEFNKISSAKIAVSNDLQDEFAREVERINAMSGKSGT